MKRDWTARIALAARLCGFERVERGFFSYLFVEKNRRRDPSNVISGGVKLIEDALQEASLLEGDGWKQVRGLRAHWRLGASPGALLMVSTGRCMRRWELNNEYERIKGDAKEDAADWDASGDDGLGGDSPPGG